MIDRIRTWLGIGRATLIDDTGELQLVQVTEGDIGGGIGDRVSDNVKRVAEYGFFSVPPLGAEVVVLYRSADRNKPVVVATSHRPSRPRDKQPGDAGIYNGVTAGIIELTEAGLLIDCAGLPARIQNFSMLTIDGNVTVTGNLTVDRLVTGDGAPIELGALRDAYNAHEHPVTTAPGTTGTTDHPVS